MEIVLVKQIIIITQCQYVPLVILVASHVVWEIYQHNVILVILHGTEIQLVLPVPAILTFMMMEPMFVRRAIIPAKLATVLLRMIA